MRYPGTKCRDWPRPGRRAVLATSIGLLLLPPACSRESTPVAKPADAAIKNVVIILIDTLRADHLGCYGYPRETSPNIDRLAAESVVFDRAFSVSPWTRTSVVSLFTSLHAPTHACQDREDSATSELVMMPEIFQAGGYRTYGLSTNISISAKFNLHQGFDEFTYFERSEWNELHPQRPDPGYVPIEGMMPKTLAWLDEVGDQPFFLYFHCTDPHFKYDPPREFMLWGTTPYHCYDGEVRYVDHHVGRLIDRLRALGKLDETLLIVTADHGEEWGDHLSMGHGHTLYNELLEVPLIVRHPSFTPGRRSEIVRLIDVLPTLIELCGLQAPEAELQGRSLVPLLRGMPDPEPEAEFVLGEVMYPSKVEAVSYQTDGWKLIWILQDARGKKDVWELYYTAHDGREKTNVLPLHPKFVAALRQTMDELRKDYTAKQVEGAKSMLDAETLEALRSLGYVE